MKQGCVYMRQAGTSEEWRDVGSAPGFSFAIEVNESIEAPKLPTQAEIRGGFEFSRGGINPEPPKPWGRNANTVNNRGEARKEEKHVDVTREFKDEKGGKTLAVEPDLARRTQASGGVHLDISGGGEPAYGWFDKVDVPLIAHALFEKSGWPDVKEYDREVAVRVGPQRASAIKPESQSIADLTLARAIANLAAYNAWVEGAAARLEAEVAAEAARVEAEERRSAENARKREHDALRTSAIALEALKLYNANCLTSHESWDATQDGHGRPDDRVEYWIAKAEAARAAKPAPKLGDRVRVSAEGVRKSGACFGGEVEGVVVSELDGEGDIKIKAPTANYPLGMCQYIEAQYVTVLATAEEVAAEKLKAEREAGIAAILKADDVILTCDAVRLYDRGIRATA